MSWTVWIVRETQEEREWRQEQAARQALKGARRPRRRPRSAAPAPPGPAVPLSELRAFAREYPAVWRAAAERFNARPDAHRKSFWREFQGVFHAYRKEARRAKK